MARVRPVGDSSGMDKFRRLSIRNGVLGAGNGQVVNMRLTHAVGPWSGHLGMPEHGDGFRLRV